MTQALALIEPLAPPDCDCRGLPFMPLHTVRLLDSDFLALSTGDEFKAAVILWSKAWQQSPASSLPDNDRILAKWTGFPINVWMEVREMALRGFIKCSDGNLYHPLIADLAMTASRKRRGQKNRADSRWEAERARKNSEKNPEISHGISHGTEKPMPRHAENDAVAMQGRGRVKGKSKEEKRTPTGVPKERAVGTRIPASWQLTSATVAFARSRQFTDDEIRHMRDRFKNHWLASSSAGAVKVDWDAAWRTWVMKDAESRGPRQAESDRPVIGGVVDLEWC